ncbi:MAG: hypothetical protein LBS08_03705 [Candidatus Symbiothrix sp.]|jgi:hypothetical protein|nr:hypothetical protein [Candidatus Symbiothrix sp.]
MKNKDFFKNNPSIGESQVLSDEQLLSIEGGACDCGCKKQCITNMNGSDNDSVSVQTEVQLAKN